MRFFRRKYLIIAFAVILLLIIVAAAALFVYIQSPQFNETARKYIIREIAKRTGAVVELNEFQWDLWRRHFRLDNLTIHGREAASESPLAVFPRIEIGLNLRTLLQKKVNLFELTLTSPAFHIIIDPQGKTNFPTPSPSEPTTTNIEVAIENFRIVHGSTLINERQIDTDLVVTNLESEMSYHSTTGILNGHLRYDGEYKRYEERIIPYTFDAEMDFTHGTLLPHRITIHSGRSVIRLQGRINDLVNKRIAGHLEYTGNVEVPFLNYFFHEETFSGEADVAGFMEFSDGHFLTRGTTASDSLTYDGWLVKALRTEYSYSFQDKQAVFKNIQTQVVGGKASGTLTIDNIPGPGSPRLLLDINYAGVDGTQLRRLYPWDPKYRIVSSLTGTLRGWFEGKFDRYSLAGNVNLRPLANGGAQQQDKVVGGVVPLVLEGATQYQANPGQVRVTNADVRLGATHIHADGLIDKRTSDVSFALDSSDLRDAYFIYSGANGSGTFSGTLTGPIQNPVFAGNFDLHHHVYQNKWTIDGATGHVNLDTATNVAALDKVHVTEGGSEIVISGSTNLTGTPADLDIQALRVHGEDLRQFVAQKFGGSITGTLRLTSFSPMQVEGDLRGQNLQINDTLVGDGRAHIRYFEPAVDLSSVSINRNGSSLTGNFSFNQTTEAMKFSTRVASVDFDSLRWIGLPEALHGTIAQANLQGEGTLKQPDVRGTGVIRNLSFETETFPEVRFNVSSAGSNVDLAFQTANNLMLAAQINTASKTFPFTAKATFTQYSVERLAGFSQGNLTVTGFANMSGLLTDIKAFRGDGRVESATATIQDKTVRIVDPFTFNFNRDRLELSNVTIAGEGTQGTLAGTIGFTKGAPLNLDVRGQFDLGLLAARTGDWTPAGKVNVDGRVRGTPQNPDLRGVAHFANASISKKGLFTTLTDVNGDLGFDGSRITLNGVKGQMGGGTVTVEGVATLRENGIQSMNLLITPDSVRIRYPEGVRTVINGALALRGSWAAPVLEGDLKIQSMTYRSNFEDLLTMFGGIGTAPSEPTPFDRLRLAIHVEGARNITIENEFANVQARIELDVRGTVAKPALTGHIEANGGTVSFQGKTYTVTRGNVDFIDPLKIEPSIDIQAETQIRDYRVILAVSGKGEHLRVDMRSDPPLPQIEVLNLIAGGKSRQELAESPNPTNVTQEQLFKGSAASILSDIVQQRLGGSAIQRLGIGRVRIGPDPSIVSSRNQTTIRVTIEEQVSKDLTVTYSRELSADKLEIIQVEYFVNKNISVIASKDEFDQKGLDIKFRKRFK